MKSLYLCSKIKNKTLWGNLKRNIKNSRILKKNVVNLNEISGTLSKEEKEKLMSGNGFVKVPTEELKRLRVDVYPYVM